MGLPDPKLITFDIFGTVLDWRTGLRETLHRHGRELADADFDRVIDRQGELESGAYRPYAEIFAESLVDVLAMSPADARAIGRNIGTWPLYPDSREALARLMQIAPCAAISNSDRAHGEDVQAQLGFRLSHWICAEDARCYKPARAAWRFAGDRIGAAFDGSWWHVSAYGDYDLVAARELGLTGVFIARSHHRPGPAAISAASLDELVTSIFRAVSR